MDTLVRGRRLLLIAAGAALLACACAGARHRAGEPVGVSDAPPSSAAGLDAGADGAAHGKAAAAGLLATFRAHLVRVNKAPFVSNGHAAGRWDADVYATAAGKDAAITTAAGGELPVGTRFVMEHTERAADHAPGPLMLMEKMDHGFDPDHGDWRYAVIGSTGDLVQDGRIESCAGCHDDAPRDHVFHVAE